MKKQPDNIFLLSVISFAAQAAIAGVNLTLIYFLRSRFSLSSQMIGISAAVYTLSYFFFCSIVDPLASKMRPSFALEFALAGMALSIALVMFSPSMTLVIPSLILYGFFMAFFWPQIAGWMSRGKEGKVLSRATGSFNVSWSVGVAVAPLATGFLVEYDVFLALSVFAGMLFFVAILTQVFTRISPEMKSAVSEHTNRRMTDFVDASTPIRYASWVGNLTLYVVLAVVLTIFPLYALDSLPYNESLVGILLFIRGAVTAVVFILMGKSSFWHFRRSLIAITLILASLLTVAAQKITSFGGFTLFFIIFGVLFAAMYSFSIFHGFTGSINRTRRMLIHESLLTVGTVIGNVFGASLYQFYGFPSVLTLCSIILLVPLPLLLIGYRKKIEA